MDSNSGAVEKLLSTVAPVRDGPDQEVRTRKVNPCKNNAAAAGWSKNHSAKGVSALATKAASEE